MIVFEYPLLLSLSLLSLPALYLALRSDSRFKRITLIVKALTVILVSVAAASPSIIVQEELRQEAEAVVLDDQSRSMDGIQSSELDLRDVSTTRRVIASGNSSDLKTGILENVERNSVYLLKSDLQSSSSMRGVAEAIRRRNSTIHLLKTGEKEDSSVWIEGPETTYPGAENTFTVRTSSTSGEVVPMVRVEGEKVELSRESDERWSFQKKFPEKGYYRISASVNSEDDLFEGNNQYFRSVKVTERPDILVLGEEGRIGKEFSDFYNFEYRDSVPEDLTDFYAVLIKEEVPEAELSSFLAEGNGLVYTGDYKSESSLLPFRKVDSKQRSEGAKIVIVIDISIASGKCATETCLSKERREQAEVKNSKKIAFSLVHEDSGLGFNNKVGIIAYNNKAHLIQDIEPLGETRQRPEKENCENPVNIKDKIACLDPSGPSYHHTGLKGAKKMLNGTGNIIMITDGEDTEPGRSVNTMQKSRNIASKLDVKLITVGVRQDTNRPFLRDLARRGGGQYLPFTSSNRLNFMFEGGGTETSAESLYVVDRSHFVTEGYEAEGTASGFDSVETKPGARLLVSSQNGKPFLSSWRYGIGRVAAFSGGTKDLGRVLFQDSELVSKTFSWAVGDPERKQENRLSISDSHIGEKVKVESSRHLEGLNRQGDDLYTAELKPESTGFHMFANATHAYNYNPEIRNTGYRDAEDFARSTGGEVFSPDQEEEISRAIKQLNSRKVQKQKNVSKFFLAAALLVFLGEVGYRKRKGKK